MAYLELKLDALENHAKDSRYTSKSPTGKSLKAPKAWLKSFSTRSEENVITFKSIPGTLSKKQQNRFSVYFRPRPNTRPICSCLLIFVSKSLYKFCTTIHPRLSLLDCCGILRNRRKSRRKHPQRYSRPEVWHAAAHNLREALTYITVIRSWERG